MLRRCELHNEEESHFLDALAIYLNNPEYFETAGTDPVTRETLIEDLAALPPGVSRENKHFYLYTDGERPAALLDLVLHYPDEDTFYIGLLMVDGNKHRAGIGSLVYQELEAEMQAQGYCRARLGILEQNQKAWSFWSKMGFRKIRTVVSSIQSEKNWTVHVMEKQLLS